MNEFILPVLVLKPLQSKVDEAVTIMHDAIKELDRRQAIIDELVKACEFTLKTCSSGREQSGLTFRWEDFATAEYKLRKAIARAEEVPK